MSDKRQHVRLALASSAGKRRFVFRHCEQQVRLAKASAMIAATSGGIVFALSHECASVRAE
jgi:hypothetical protein